MRYLLEVDQGPYRGVGTLQIHFEAQDDDEARQKVDRRVRLMRLTGVEVGPKRAVKS